MKLTERELDVLAYVLIGEKSYQSVAEILNINKSTVNTYIRRVLNKAKCTDVSDLREHIWIYDLEDRYKQLTGGAGFSLDGRMLFIGLIISLNIFVIFFALKVFKVFS